VNESFGANAHRGKVARSKHTFRIVDLWSKPKVVHTNDGYVSRFASESVRYSCCLGVPTVIPSYLGYHHHGIILNSCTSLVASYSGIPEQESSTGRTQTHPLKRQRSDVLRTVKTLAALPQSHPKPHTSSCHRSSLLSTRRY
jgi:hypothetical protein